ncbi:hypothetical protein M1D72_05420 [Vibrio sp. AK197]|uniref:DUF2846 domain-containing protein n=1 Tax=Vibrio olivae TaxID=1243002 RepID=A0ABV5HV83_9VIBR
MKTWILIGVLSALLTGCSCGPAFVQGEMEEEYEVKTIGQVEDNSPVVYGAHSVYFTKVNRQKLSGIKYLRLGLSGFPNAIRLPEGEQTLYLWRDGNPDFNLFLSKIQLVNDHKYLVDYITKPEGNFVRIFYWVEDLNDGSVVYGKRVTPTMMTNTHTQ